MSVSINPPKTPVTEGSHGIAAATVPNVCKMPGPPAPFVPTPLPNIGQSGDSPKGYSATVTIEGKKVAIRGASFGSQGDIASKGTGGGLVSSNTHGPCKFIGPGSMNVQIEGKNVQLLGDPMLNNCGPSGSPANAATLAGIIQNPVLAAAIAKNPERKDICGAGNHKERIAYPEPPERDLRKRLETMRKLADTEGKRFEVAAAEHDIREGDITHPRQLSRDLTPEEREAGFHSDNQKIWAVCDVCGYRRELDQAPQKPKRVVEAKSSIDATKDKKQKDNNRALAGRGVESIYKIPAGATPKELEGLTDFTIVPIKI